MKTLGERLRKIRNSARLTQRELADLVGVKTRQIARYEADDAMPRPYILNTLEEALSIPPGFLSQDFNENHKQYEEVTLNIPTALHKSLCHSSRAASRPPEVEILMRIEETYRQDSFLQNHAKNADTQPTYIDLVDLYRDALQEIKNWKELFEKHGGYQLDPDLTQEIYNRLDRIEKKIKGSME